MRATLRRAVGALRGLRPFWWGALIAVPLFPLAAFAMGFFAGVHGMPAPQVDTSQLQAAIGHYFAGE